MGFDNSKNLSLDDFNLENIPENCQLLSWNKDYFKRIQLLYRLHSTYPNLYYAGHYNKYPQPLIIEAPSLYLTNLISISEITDNLKRYNFLGYSSNAFKAFNIMDFSNSVFTNMYLKKYPSIFDGLYMYNSELWYECNKIQSPLAWIFRYQPKRLPELYVDYAIKNNL